VDVSSLRNEQSYYILIDTVKLLWCNLYCEKRYKYTWLILKMLIIVCYTITVLL